MSENSSKKENFLKLAKERDRKEMNKEFTTRQIDRSEVGDWPKSKLTIEVAVGPSGNSALKISIENLNEIMKRRDDLEKIIGSADSEEEILASDKMTDEFMRQIFADAQIMTIANEIKDVVSKVITEEMKKQPPLPSEKRKKAS